MKLGDLCVYKDDIVDVVTGDELPGGAVLVKMYTPGHSDWGWNYFWVSVSELVLLVPTDYGSD